MADSKVKIVNIASFNLHGFNQGREQLSELCTFCDIIAIQEHWLADHNINKLVSLNDDFTAVFKSALSDRLQKDFLCGRPFGGLGLLVKKNLHAKLTIVGTHSDCRCMAVMLTLLGGYKLLIIVVYFPCKQTNNYENVLLDCIGFLDSCIASNEADAVIIMGDMNFECSQDNLGFSVFKDFADEVNLSCCDCFWGSKNIPYTYLQESTSKSSFIDHMFLNNSLVNNIVKFYVHDSGVNFSDHLPVVCELALPVGKCCKLHSGKANTSDSNTTQKQGLRRWDKGNISKYYELTGRLLQRLQCPISLLTVSGNRCFCLTHDDIDRYYNDIVLCLHNAADAHIPVFHGNALKHYWSTELNELKLASIEAYKAWNMAGRPRQGILNKIRLECKYKYKFAIRNAAMNEENLIDDEISELYLRKDLDKFWKKWSSKFSKRPAVASNIDGFSVDQEIANHLCNSFVDVCFDSYADTHFNAVVEQHIHNTSDGATNANSNFFSVSDVEFAVKQLKSGKAPGFDGITVENILYSHPAIIVHLKLLFNMIWCHGYVPNDFGIGIIVPLLKDKLGDINSANNYRPITLSPVITKIFEHCLLNKFEPQLVSSDLQFGFKRGSGCQNAIFALRQVIEYFNQRGSTIYVAALDAKKAFDRVHHMKLLNVLLTKGLPGKFVKIIMNWYSKISAAVRWNNSVSLFFQIRSGIRQGSVLSPCLFNIYFDTLVTSLENSDLGCHIRDKYIGIILYADDIMILSASLKSLQKMLDICHNCGASLDIVFNVNKSWLFKVGPSHLEELDALFIGGQELKWSKNIKYLGIILVSAKEFKVDITVQVRKFYAAANAIMSNCKQVSDLVKLQLLESFTLPLLTYACEALNLHYTQVHQLSVCWNNTFRKIFHMNKWESVKIIQLFCGRFDFVRLYHQRKISFVLKLCKSHNLTHRTFINNYIKQSEFVSLCDEYNIKIGATCGFVKSVIGKRFAAICA